MKKIFKVALILIASLALFGCEKEEETKTTTTLVPTETTTKYVIEYENSPIEGNEEDSLYSVQKMVSIISSLEDNIISDYSAYVGGYVIEIISNSYGSNEYIIADSADGLLNDARVKVYGPSLGNNTVTTGDYVIFEGYYQKYKMTYSPYTVTFELSGKGKITDSLYRPFPKVYSVEHKNYSIEYTVFKMPEATEEITTTFDGLEDTYLSGTLATFKVYPCNGYEVINVTHNGNIVPLISDFYAFTVESVNDLQIIIAPIGEYEVYTTSYDMTYRTYTGKTITCNFKDLSSDSLCNALGLDSSVFSISYDKGESSTNAILKEECLTLYAYKATEADPSKDGGYLCFSFKENTLFSRTATNIFIEYNAAEADEKTNNNCCSIYGGGPEVPANASLINHLFASNVDLSSFTIRNVNTNQSSTSNIKIMKITIYVKKTLKSA